VEMLLLHHILNGALVKQWQARAACEALVRLPGSHADHLPGRKTSCCSAARVSSTDYDKQQYAMSKMQR
jgi:hypothetical protein